MKVDKKFLVNFDVKNNFSRVLTLLNCCMNLAIL